MDPPTAPEDSLTAAHPPPVHSLSSETAAPSLDLFQQTVLLTEGMNVLKCHLNAEKQTRCETPAHLDPISSDEEELLVPISSVPILPLFLSPPATGPTIKVPAVNYSLCSLQMTKSKVIRHIYPLSYMLQLTPSTLPASQLPLL